MAQEQDQQESTQGESNFNNTSDASGFYRKQKIRVLDDEMS